MIVFVFFSEQYVKLLTVLQKVEGLCKVYKKMTPVSNFFADLSSVLSLTTLLPCLQVMFVKPSKKRSKWKAQTPMHCGILFSLHTQVLYCIYYTLYREICWQCCLLNTNGLYLFSKYILFLVSIKTVIYHFQG